MKVTVTNSGHNSVEAAGHVFPPRRTVEVDVDAKRLGELEECSRLSADKSAKADANAEKKE